MMGFICSAGSAGNNKAPVQNEMGKNQWLCWGFPACQKWPLGWGDTRGRFLLRPSQGFPAPWAGTRRCWAPAVS